MFLISVSFSSPVECGNLVKQMVKYRLVTKQTPPEGVEVQKVGKYLLNSGVRGRFV
jgi:hypothetical protein